MWKKKQQTLTCTHARHRKGMLSFHLVCSACSLFFHRHFYLTALLPMKMLLLLRLQLLFFCSFCSSVFTKYESELLWFSANEHFHYRTITNKGRWNIWHIFIENRIIDRKFQKIEIKHTLAHTMDLVCFALIVMVSVSRIYFYRTVDCHALIKMKINKSIEFHSRQQQQHNYQWVISKCVFSISSVLIWLVYWISGLWMHLKFWSVRITLPSILDLVRVFKRMWDVCES